MDILQSCSMIPSVITDVTFNHKCSSSHRIWSDSPIHCDGEGLACFLWVAWLLGYHTLLQSLPGESHNVTELPDILVPQKENWTQRTGGQSQ